MVEIFQHTSRYKNEKSRIDLYPQVVLRLMRIKQNNKFLGNYGYDAFNYFFITILKPVEKELNIALIEYREMLRTLIKFN